MGLIHIYFGDGKGKTTAAMGLCTRMAGCEKNVLISQFLKCGDSGEIQHLKSCEFVEVLVCDKKRGFFYTMSEKEKEETTKEIKDLFLKVTNKAVSGSINLLVLDEILDVINLGIISESDVISFLKTKPENIEVVLTGRNPSEELLEVCDYVTEMKKIKHPFDKGLNARYGIEY